MHSKSKILSVCALFTALTCVSSFIKIQIPGFLPFTLQSLVVMLSALMLPPRYSAVSQTLYLAIGLAGVPVFAMGGGPAYVLYPSFGFLLGFVPASFVASKIYSKKAWRNGTKKTEAFSAILSMAVGNICIYSFGIMYLYVLGGAYGIYDVFVNYFLVFLPYDIVKCICAVFLYNQIKRKLPAFIYSLRQ